MNDEELALEGGALERITLQMTSTLDLDELLETITRGLVEELGAKLSRVWLVGPGDRCASCVQAPGCDHRERCLHLRASSGLSTRLDGEHGRVPLGALKIGQIASSGAPIRADGLEGDARISDHAWARRNQLASFAGYPLVFRGEVLGVVAMFSSDPLSEARFRRLALFAARASIAIANARLFAELDRLRGRLESENAYLQGELRRAPAGGEILGSSPALLAALEQLDQVARTQATVLLGGETGTGKELFARALHARSPRREGPLVNVNCAAISASLVESELFGHEKGAFTGAVARRIGRFELAHGGTLFLDEVGELSPEVQAKLLRVLQDRELERVGGSQTIRVDVRLVAATNRDLPADVRAGRFRSDLYYRLAVFPIVVPPLRARRADLPLLVEAFVARERKALGKPLRGATPEALKRLAQYSFPGNVRELRNMIERAAIVARGEWITPADLPDLGDDAPEEPRAPTEGRTLEDVERAHLASVLREADWVIEGPAGAAATLGLKPSTLRSLMSKLGIRRPRGAPGG